MELGTLAAAAYSRQNLSSVDEPLTVSHRMNDITYAVRDIVLVAREAQQAGKELLYLNIGDPTQFDFRTPDHIVDAIDRALRDNQTSYAPSEGLPEALEAIRRSAEAKGIRAIQDVFVGHGTSECIEVAFAALLNEGENVLTPTPGYPLFPTVLAKLKCDENSYFLDEANGWQPDLADIEAKINDKTRGIVVINPNNPTGSVCSRENLEGILEIAARHRLVVFADEIYDRLVLDGEHFPMASLRDDLPILSFNGLSKAFLSTGLRMGWCVSSGPARRLKPYIEAMHKLLRTRLCANHVVQFAIAPALEGSNAHIEDMKTRLRRRRDLMIDMFKNVDEIDLVPPAAAFYAFPRLNIKDSDEAFVKRLIRATGVVLVHGAGFGERPNSAHMRIVYLPPDDILKRAFTQIVDFIRQDTAAP